jgi:gamma-glutamyl AIG2-like cyclotransferase
MTDVASSAAGSAADRADALLFVYGTLRFPDVVEGLLGRRVPAQAATAPGWRAAPLRGRVYPGLVAAVDGGQADGFVLAGLAERDWMVFDDFEGPPYLLSQIGLGDGRLALTYVWRDQTQVCDGVWDPARFAVQHLASYAHRARAWRGRGVP